MHYADGTPAKLGDLVRHSLKEGSSGTEVMGILVSATSTSDTCNGQLDPVARRIISSAGKTGWLPYRPQYDYCATLLECYPVKTEETRTA